MRDVTVEKIIAQFSKAKSGYELVEQYYHKYLVNQDDSEEYFRWICNNFEDIIRDEDRNNREYVLLDSVAERIKSILPIVSRVAHTLSKKDLEPDDFYSELWKQLCNEILFPTEENKIDAVYGCLISSYVPYYKVPQYSQMNDGTYQQITDRIMGQVRRIRFGSFVQYEQLTQTAQYTLDILGSLGTIEEKAVFLSHVFKIVSYLAEQADEEER